MPVVLVDFGTANYHDTKTNVHALCEANVELRTDYHRFENDTTIEALTLQHLDLWTRCRRPLIFEATFDFDASLRLSNYDVLTLQQVLMSTISAAELWKDIHLEVVNQTLLQRATDTGASTVCLEFELGKLEWPSAQVKSSSKTKCTENTPDVNEINCPRSVPQASLETLRTKIYFSCRKAVPDSKISSASRNQHFALANVTTNRPDDDERSPSTPDGRMLSWVVGLTDACLRSFVSQRKFRLIVGIRFDSNSLVSSLQDVFPAIFNPACLEAIISRMQAFSSVVQTLQSSSKRTGERLLGRHFTTSCPKSHIETDPTYERQKLLTRENLIERKSWSNFIQHLRTSSGSRILSPLKIPTIEITEPQMLEVLPGLADNISPGLPPCGTLVALEDLMVVENDECGSPDEKAQCNSSPITSTILQLASQPGHSGHQEWSLIEDGDLFRQVHEPPEKVSDFVYSGTNTCLSHDSLNIPDYLTEVEECRSMESRSSHMSVLMEAGWLCENDIGGQNAQGSSECGLIGEANGLSQTTTRWNPLLPKRGMACTDRLSDTINASSCFEIEDLADNELLFPTFTEDLFDFSRNNPTNETESKDIDLIQSEEYINLNTNYQFATLTNTYTDADLPIVFASTVPTLEQRQDMMSNRNHSSATNIRQPPPALQIRTERDHESYMDSRPSSKRSSTVSTFSSLTSSPTNMSSRGGKLLRKFSTKKSKGPERVEIDFDLTNIGSRTMEIKRRKTLDDYDFHEGSSSDEEEMLFH